MAVNIQILFEYPEYRPYFSEPQELICDAEGNRRVISKMKMLAAIEKGKLNPVAHFHTPDPELLKKFEIYRARQKMSGTLLDEFIVLDGNVFLTKVHIERGAYTIPEFVSGIFYDKGRSPFFDAIDLKLYNLSRIADFGSMFALCRKLVRLDLSEFDTSKANNMSSMFSSCESLEYLDASGMNTSGVVSMIDMFNGCRKLKSLNLSTFDTSQVAIMNNMFNNCYSLSDLNISNFNIARVYSMNGMFYQDSALRKLDLSSFRKNHCCEMIGMFASCRNLQQLNLKNMPVLAKANISAMFKDCPNVPNYELKFGLRQRVLGPVEWA